MYTEIMNSIRYPYHIESKDELYRIVKDTPENLLKGRAYNDVVNSHMTDWNRIQKHQIVSKFIEWIEEETNCEMINIWGVLYSDQGGSNSHNHKGAKYSFSYYINVPNNSSPLVFDTENISVPAIEGNVVIFDANLMHSVPLNDHNGRCILSGNLIDRHSYFAAKFGIN